MGIKERRLEKIKKAIFKKPFVFYFIFIFSAYVGLNLFINKLYISLSILSSFALWFLIPFLFFNFLITPFLVALTINLSILRFKEAGPGLKIKGKESGATSVGVFAGVLGGACPGCFVGLFPAVLGFFGITASLSILPLYGLEIQFFSAAFLIFAIFLLTKDIVCEVPIKTK